MTNTFDLAIFSVYGNRKTATKFISRIVFDTYLKFFLYMRNDAGMPITNGVGAKSSCSAQLMQVGSSGITGNIYSSG